MAQTPSLDGRTRSSPRDGGHAHEGLSVSGAAVAMGLGAMGSPTPRGLGKATASPERGFDWTSNQAHRRGMQVVPIRPLEAPSNEWPP